MSVDRQGKLGGGGEGHLDIHLEPVENPDSFLDFCPRLRFGHPQSLCWTEYF